jgi:hypothetical protein
MGKSYWQVAAGSKGRNYANLFIKFGLAFVGGDPHVKTMSQVAPGDIIILKDGLSIIVAVGEVVSRNGKHNGCDDKPWLRDFDGWDLRAWCNVDWRVPKAPHSTTGLTRTTIQRVHQDNHMKIADNLLQLPKSPFVAEPPTTAEVTDSRILEFLVAEGLRPSAAEDLTNTFRRIRLLAEYYYNNCAWEEIREHETRTFLIVPLLLALGWAEQQLKIEYPATGGRVDLACFSRAQNQKNSECALILESKDFASGLDYAQEQARSYAKSFPSCRVLVVSNGYCYKTYIRDSKSAFSATPSAYLNVLKPRTRYPLDPENVDGALEVLRWLLPVTLR